MYLGELLQTKLLVNRTDTLQYLAKRRMDFGGATPSRCGYLDFAFQWKPGKVLSWGKGLGEALGMGSGRYLRYCDCSSSVKCLPRELLPCNSQGHVHMSSPQHQQQ